jgi:hypothetical protein
MLLIGSAGIVLELVEGTPVKAVAAGGTYTIASGGSVIQNLDTITIGTKTYTFMTTLGTTEGQVHIGATDTTALANLVLAITHGSNSGNYYCAAAHPTATATSTATTLVVVALVAGAAGNSIATTESSAGSFAYTTLGGGGSTNPTGSIFGVDATLNPGNLIYVDGTDLYYVTAPVTSVSATIGWFKAAGTGI